MNFVKIVTDEEYGDRYQFSSGTGTGKSCSPQSPFLQQWLRDNADNLPADIQAKVEAGELTIQEADNS